MSKDSIFTDVVIDPETGPELAGNNDYAALEDWLNQRYDFRFDVLKGMPYYKPKKGTKFIEISDRAISSIQRKLRLQSYKHSTILPELLNSEFSPEFHAIENYFKMNSRHYSPANQAIKKLAKTVEVINDKGSNNWEEYLRKWLVGCVASGLNRDLKGAKNHVCLVLCGGQGAGKTTWLNALCPPDLQDYFFSNKIDIQNKDLLATLCNCFLINIDDQLKSLGRKNAEELKNLITMPFLKYRKSYGRVTETHPRIASFMGSINEIDFLDDPTGSRRFLSFLVNKIDYKTKVDINQVWAEAHHLYKEGFKYWFDGKEIEELNEHNKQFQTQTIEEEYLLKFFEPVDKDANGAEFLTSADILNDIQLNTTLRNINPKKLGSALTKHGFIKWQKGTQRISGWSVRRVNK